jgi:hypothetical protein
MVDVSKADQHQQIAHDLPGGPAVIDHQDRHCWIDGHFSLQQSVLSPAIGDVSAAFAALDCENARRNIQLIWSSKNLEAGAANQSRIRIGIPID